jgi:hypothetical protein
MHKLFIFWIFQLSLQINIVNMDKKKITSSIEITELFLVRADWHRTFMAEIIRETTADGKEFVRGSVIIEEGKAWSIGNSQEELANNLDDICTLKLDYNLHYYSGAKFDIMGLSFHLN